MDLQDEATPEELGTWIGREKKFRLSGFASARIDSSASVQHALA
jgi:hypothetical protein